MTEKFMSSLIGMHLTDAEIEIKEKYPDVNIRVASNQTRMKMDAPANRVTLFVNARQRVTTVRFC